MVYEEKATNCESNYPRKHLFVIRQPVSLPNITTILSTLNSVLSKSVCSLWKFFMVVSHGDYENPVEFAVDQVHNVSLCVQLSVE